MLVLAYHGSDYDRARRIRDAAQAATAAERVAGRNGDAWAGEIETTLNHVPVSAIYAPDHPEIAHAYALAGITVLTADLPGMRPIRVAILCPGPSLPSIWPPPADWQTYDHSIAVNRAMDFQPAGTKPDWWCCGDEETWAMFQHAGWPRRGIVGRCASVAAPAELAAHPVLGMLPCAAHNWTACMAVWWASSELRANRIDLFGADMAGAQDFRGQSCHGRSPDRWQAEAQILAELTAMLAGQGVVVARVQAPAVPLKPRKAKG